MGLPVLHQNDPWGQVGSALGNSLVQGSQLAQKEQSDARSEQRKAQYGREEEGRQESRLKEALQSAYSNPEFKDGDLDKRQQILYQAIAPINPEVANKIANANIDSYKAKNPVVKPAKPEPAKPLSPFEKKKQELAATEYEKLQTEIPKLQGQLKTINNLRDLSRKELTGLKGYGKALLGSESASQFDAQGLTLIEPIIKIFNPVGAIPIAKIELVKQKFAPKATDTQRTIEGKLNAIESFTKQALSRAQERMKIIQDYEGNPPPALLNEFDKQSEGLIDVMDTYNPEKGTYGAPKEEKSETEDMPPAKDFEGKIIKNKKTGKRMISKNGKWESL